MTIKEYLDEHIKGIANKRGWDCKREGCSHDCRTDCAAYDSQGGVDCRPTCRKSCLRRCEETNRVDFCPRMRDYVRYIEELLPYMDKDMTDVTFDDVTFALNQVRDRYGYAEATVRGIQSCVRVVFLFAEEHSCVYNIMKYGSFQGCKKDILSILTSGRSQKAIHHELQEQREQHKHKTKSLTIEQLEKLTRIVWKNIEDDGRYCMIALMLYAGIRPAEGRTLAWGDIVPFVDHPERWILNLYRTRDGDGTLKQHMKTHNAFRRIPVHCELMALLKKRRDFVLKANAGKDISRFPVCCLGNDFEQPCRDFEVCQLTDRVFSSDLKLKQEDMYIYMLEAELEKLSERSGCADKDQQLTLYVLRRAFWTWCESLTSLTDFEKRYIMGHDMKVENHSVHSQYNNENRLWEICQKLDHCVLGKNLHENNLLFEPADNAVFQVENRGIVYIHLTREMLAKGGVLKCSVTTEEAGEAISLVSQSALRKYGKLVSCAEVFPVPVKNELPVGINCEYENWVAHGKYAKSDDSQKERKIESGETISVD